MELIRGAGLAGWPEPCLICMDLNICFVLVPVCV